MRAARAAAVVYALLVARAVSAAPQQQGSIQLSTESQVIRGDAARRAGEEPFQPDFGVLWQQPNAKFGQFVLETRGTRRDGDVHLGRTWMALRDAKRAGFTWSFEAGDLFTSPAAGDYQFSNLSAPAFTFSGAAVTARNPKLTLQIVAGRTTALRNLFGTDPDALGQSVGIGRATAQPNRRVQINARAARTRTWDLREFSPTTEESTQAGGGTRLIVTPWLHVVADGSYVRYRAAGASLTRADYSYLGGAHLLLARGWVQVNANRFSPGDLPVLNAALRDRQGLFGAAEYDVLSRVRLFGGWQSVSTNIEPAGVSLLRPTATVDRAYGGARLRVGERSSLSFRYEDGGRLSRPAVPDVLGRRTTSTSDTGLFSTEWQTNVRRVTAFGRYSRRSEVDATNGTGTFTQHDGAGQLFLNLSRKTQLFGVATLTHQEMLSGSGSTYLEVSAGGQRQIVAQGLWLRIEGTASRNRDLLTDTMSPRDALNVGLNGQLTSQTTLGLNVYVDRAPVGFAPADGGWLTRSTIRIIHTIPTGSVRVANGSGASISGRASRGTGSVLGSVFADWNGNSVPDAGEELLAGIPVALGTISRVTTARDGQFAFLNVAAGVQHVGLDLNAMPIDFDPPAVPDVLIELGRGDTKRVAFGLVPLGAVHGRVIEDVNKNGQIDSGEPPIDGAVVTLDSGQRSELARNGTFRFDAVRAGDHRILLVKESLPEGAVIVGDAERPLSIAHDHAQAEVVYVVRVEKRPEVRKVFPPKIGGNMPAASLPAKAGSHGVASAPIYGVASAPIHGVASAPIHGATSPSMHGGTSPRATSAAPAMTSSAASSPISRGFRLQAEDPRAPFTIQIAALTDPVRAKNIAEDLTAAGVGAYIVEPGSSDPDGPYRIRVGHYASRAAAQKSLAELEKKLGEKLWVTRGR